MSTHIDTISGIVETSEGSGATFARVSRAARTGKLPTIEPTDSDFVKRLKMAMIRKGLWTNALDREMGSTSAGRVSLLLKGAEPRDKTVEALATALGVRAAWLRTGVLPMTEQDEPPKNVPSMPYSKTEDSQAEIYAVDEGLSEEEIRRQLRSHARATMSLLDLLDRVRSKR